MPKDRKPSPLRRLSSKIKSTFDADGDGKLGFSDLGAGAKKVKERAQDMADSAADAATRLLDKDGDGHLSSKDMFRMIDRDGDGKIGFKDGLADMRQANRQAKNAIYGAAKNKMLAIFEEVYRTKLKPVMTVDRYMPWHMRAVVHEVANEVWENVLMELPNSLDKILPEEKADTPRWKRKQSSDRWAAAHIRPRRRPPRASPAPLTPPAALSLVIPARHTTCAALAARRARRRPPRTHAHR
jgi:Ca2+-binding EF-hand superfamily protein